jgi:hypothetical protein
MNNISKFYAIETRSNTGGDIFVGHLDLPRSTTIRKGHTIAFVGWILGKSFPVSKLILSVSGENIKEVRIDRASHDVAKQYPGLTGSDRCRFNENMQVEHLGNRFEITIDAVFADGSVCNYATVGFSEIEASSRPIFIVGSPRSGTTILDAALKKALNPASFNEGHVVPLLHELRRAAANYYEKICIDPSNKLVMLANIPHNLIAQRLNQIFKDLYNQHHVGREWIDKTPGGDMLRAIPTIQAVWPYAKIIFAKRRALENLVSRMKKFPQFGFEGNCRQWNDVMKEWKARSNALNPGNHLMIDQHDIATRPEDVAANLGLFLDLTADQQEIIQQTFKQDSPEQTGTGDRVQEREPLDINELNWSAEQVQIFRNICGEMMNAYGYSESKSYYQ